MAAVRNIVPIKIAHSELIAKASKSLDDEVAEELKNSGPELSLGELANHQKDTRGLKKRLKNKLDEEAPFDGGE